LDGQPATGASKGYILAAYSSAEIKGWKMNLRETADFVFTDRETTSYAAQTHGAQNGGIIAVKVIAEKYVPAQFIHWTVTPAPVVREVHHHHYPQPAWHPWPSTIYCSTTGGGSLINSLASCGPTYTSNIGAAAGSTANYDATLKAPGVPTRETDQVVQAVNTVQIASSTPDFNLGTGFGQVREDVVSEALFDRGQELATFEIYYSDEAALIAAGVPLNKAAQISKPVPQGFGGFCRPPGVSV
jgi:hypothetical protein